MNGSSETAGAGPPRRDLGALVMEWGLAAVVLLAPLPFGSVLPDASLLAERPRLGSMLVLFVGLMELAAFLLLSVWLIRAFRRPTPLPPLATRIGLIGLLALALLQTLPLGESAISRLSPSANDLRRASRSSGPALEAETRLLGTAVAELDPPATLSVDPGLSASSLRLGAAYAALLLVSTTVAALRGVRILAAALLVSAGLQGLYGVLVLASGHDMIWLLPKRYFTDAATGTFVNRNHYAGYLNGALCAGLALTLHMAKHRVRSRARAKSVLVEMFRPESGRSLLLGLFVLLGLSGLLLSFSRAGIAIGLVAFSVTLFVASGGSVRRRVVVIALVVATAAIPLGRLGLDRLTERYSHTASDLASPFGRGAVWSDTLGMARTFPATGTGFGTFSTAYPFFRSPEVRLFWRHAHNDALQVAGEGGLSGFILLLILLTPLLWRIPATFSGAHGTLAVGIAAGLAAMLAHALVDFQFHIPSNAATAAVLGGAVLGLPWKTRG